MFSSSLFNQDTFYKAFVKDLNNARNTVIIESPFITKKRIIRLMSVLRKLRLRDVRIVVNTKPLNEHNPLLYEQALWAIGEMQSIGIEVFMTVGHHRKIAIVDDVLWKGSLNILSQNDSCEMMRRIQSAQLVKEMLRFTGLKNNVRNTIRLI
ncbi:hypothetical protein COV88_01235 [Candidatus Saccharibacteria bacterium CG11_big_fil_rev_8_21_14_0_20_41_19]|nr:hypothetical protein [Candidatus Saccharibacteria bacterium]OIP86313.1 MAG: hypothetical protein AUK57_00880 [Candidatus Saccharibacteria bacterium CG2_30_41_52]PIQ71093.1 MAG: hypothetical protein COV88_01235 [Candidatus Saccharibacteria bacterium CG11_big_fil_rev_8_21_14_0_20_41_19]PIZ59910.1 MAG: hypothetical protein COY18_01995 [Candidatus Saccharibacteria bacterium CG_4_10_14_0_2_um_filter_41_11]PJC29512.1 MAG: hypothetical protein CO052_03235 [Candidatus Saccharibacteria bacterium CG_4